MADYTILGVTNLKPSVFSVKNFVSSVVKNKTTKSTEQETQSTQIIFLDVLINFAPLHQDKQRN